MQNVVRTVYGSFLQTCDYINHQLPVLPNTTLNEKFTILVDEVLAPGENPAVAYLAIGNKGHKFSIGAEGVAKPEILQHRPTDAALYNQLPFVLRDMSADLTPVERAKYAFRKVVTYNGVDYIAYYLKRVDTSLVAPEMSYKTVVTDPVTNTVTTVVEPFVPTTANLNPTPPTLSSVGTTVTTGDYVASTAKIQLDLSANEVQELLNVCNIMYGDEAYAIISEVALVSGVDRIYSLTYEGVTSNYKEVIAAQVCSFISTFISVQHSTNGVSNILDIGSTEPLLTGR
jgi:hypothetical protein